MVADIPVKVFLRVRPLSNKEIEQGCAECVQCLDESSQLIIADKMFTFDGVFAPIISQNAVYESTSSSLIEHLFKGFNCTILAYGQTGSGKTYTMGTESINFEQSDNHGITPRIIFDIFENISKSNVNVTASVSMLEIYNENVWDLLSDDRNEPLQIRESPKGGVIIPNLTKFAAKSCKETLNYLEIGCRQRSKGGTAMNAQSSRSHAVFTITLHKPAIDDDTIAFESKLHLVDLGNVISALTDPAQIKHVPYRDSRITRLLQDSLGGNSYTVFIACCSPADTNAEESLSTLRYAERARSIKNKPVLNVDPSAATIQKLKATIEQLKREYAEHNGNYESNSQIKKDYEKLKNKCSLLEAKLGELVSSKSLLHNNFVKMEEELDVYRKFYTDVKSLTNNNEEGARIRIELRQILDGIVFENLDEVARDTENKGELENSQNKTMDESVENHINLQTNLQEELEKLSDELHERKRLISKNFENEKDIEESIKKHQEIVENLQSQIAKIKSEKQELESSLKKVVISNKLSEERRKRLVELEKQLAKFERSQEELNKMKKKKDEADKEKKILQDQIKELKSTRVKMVKQLKEESLKYRQFIQKQNLEINKLKQTGQKREFQVCKEKADLKRQLEYYRKRYDDATKSRRLIQHNSKAQIGSVFKKEIEIRRNSDIGTSANPKEMLEKILHINQQLEEISDEGEVHQQETKKKKLKEISDEREVHQQEIKKKQLKELNDDGEVHQQEPKKKKLEEISDEEEIHQQETKQKKMPFKKKGKRVSNEEQEILIPAKRTRKPVKYEGFKNTLECIKTDEPEIDEDDNKKKSPFNSRPWERSKAKKTNNRITFDDQLEESNENESTIEQKSSEDMNRTYTVVEEDKHKKNNDGLSRRGLIGLNRKPLNMPKLNSN